MMRPSALLLAVGLLCLSIASAMVAAGSPSPGIKQAPPMGALGLDITFGEGSQEQMETMFLLLFIISLVGLYMASRHLKAKRRGFQAEAMRMETAKAEKPPELEAGETYLVTQGQNRALKVFSQELKKGLKGLCITRTFPDKLRESWDLEGAKIYWLANGQSRKRDAVNSLDSLSKKVSRFLEGDEKGVILLDGVEYLFVQNSFTEVMKLLQNLKDAMPSKGAKLIIPIDLLTLVERQRALLTREFRQI